MASHLRRQPSPTLAKKKPGTETWKRKVETFMIPPPVPNHITSSKALAELVKKNDPEETWLQTQESRNKFHRAARNAAKRFLDMTPDGFFTTSWAKTGASKRMDIINQFNVFEPKLGLFKDQWVAELFLNKTIKNRNVNRGAATTSTNESDAEGKLEK